MVYIITQTKGKLADAAREMWQVTCKSPNEDRAQALLSKYRPDINQDELSSFYWEGKVDCWWKYNAAGCISQKIELSEAKLKKIYSWCFENGHSYDDRAERWIVSELKKKFPDCEWKIQYEY